MRLYERLIILMVPLILLPSALIAVVALVIYQHPERIGADQTWIVEMVVGVMLVAITIVSLCVLRSAVASVARPIQRVEEMAAAMAVGARDVPMTIDPKAEGEAAHLLRAMAQLQSVLRQYEEDLRQKSADEATGQLAAQVAHDIRSPLAVLRTLGCRIRDVERESGVNLASALYVRTIGRLEAMADELRAVARAKQVDRISSDVVTVLQRTIDEVRAGLGTHVQFQYVGPSELWAAIDVEKFARLLTNLLHNAIQAIPEDRSGLVVVEMTEQAGTFALSVRDNGSGIATHVLPQIFSRHFTTKGEHGTGLGLAYCKEVVEAHAGAILARNREAGGAEFLVTLPRF
ncbi:MAG: HAMP domain-containing histidine kinase [Deltaproteobacteria bacterium]|nr:HAMP domain-containing histidine kinase [Deltaproteobacteria bacterium]